MTATVPEHLIGLWQRTLLEGEGERDTTTMVYWLQSGSLFVDLRVPRPRPTFGPAATLTDYKPGELAWLAKQEGFAGRLEVRGDRLQWRREIDFQPPGKPDIGRVSFREGLMIEFGVLDDYLEEWRQLDCDGDERIALELKGETGADGVRAPRQGIFVAVGERFMYALERRTARMKAGSHLTDLVEETRDSAEAAELLDCEIGFGFRHGRKPWEIQLCNHPWREGHALFESYDPPKHDGEGRAVQQAADGSTLHWSVDEWTEGFRF